MKQLFFVICLSIFGIFSLSISDLDNKLFDMEYSKEYAVDMNLYSDGYIPQFTDLYFRCQ